ncbi:2-keto-4-pentenoate hydratase [Sphingomonas canadensis]|uniref:2-keto-4-pentenoate hydratase n=1 Tax=Sphingomonas canadensis TaxID=1219257 RepID=A0ABW3HC13_9SPHN|nr:2-keto-4-pentenoate hydratase [Sphingomonas canadensis]MCW3837412.1 2-keto-4-pentenoate hydratase [Sphingomonas canadensis]
MERDEAGMNEGERIAQAFVAARRDARAIAAYPGAIPATLGDAYAIQARAITLAGEPVAGWKVGRIHEPLATRLGSDRLAGPIFAGHVVTAEPAPAMPVFVGGFAAAEAEFLLRIGARPDPAKRSYTHAEAVALIDAVHVGIEIASSPYARINEDGPTVTVSDFGNNHGLVIGPPVPDWRGCEFLRWPVTLLIDGRDTGPAMAKDMLDGPFGAAAFLFALAAERGIALEPGQWISTGAVNGVHEMQVGEEAVARFGDALEVRCTIAAAQPALRAAQAG